MIILLVLLWLPLCFCVAAYAANKGRSGVVGFVVAFLFSPLIGFIVVATWKTDADVIAERAGMVKCHACAEYIKPDATVCRYCRSEVQHPAAVTEEVDQSAPAISPTGKVVLTIVAVVFLALMVYASIMQSREATPAREGSTLTQ
jgi:hypothetical protein